MASASAIREALITNLGAASVFGSENVSQIYDVMETSSACCCIISFAGYVNEAMTFGNNRRESWPWLLEVKIKDTGAPEQVKDNVDFIIDKIIASLKSDDTLQGTAAGIGGVTAEREPNTAEVIGGATWLPVDVLVEVVAWD